MSHLGGSHHYQADGNTWMPDVWEYLIEKYGINSVCDIGCGGGFIAKWFLDRGFDVLGIEGDPLALKDNQLPKENLCPHDYAAGPLKLCREYHLAWCSEFVEHVDEQFIPNFVATFKCCKYLCMTHGEPGQDGFHHVNCQLTRYWIENLFKYGFKIDADETAYLRSTDKWKAPWGRRTLCWFRNLDFDDNAHTLEKPAPSSAKA